MSFSCSAFLQGSSYNSNDSSSQKLALDVLLVDFSILKVEESRNRVRILHARAPTALYFVLSSRSDYVQRSENNSGSSSNKTNITIKMSETVALMALTTITI